MYVSKDTVYRVLFSFILNVLHDQSNLILEYLKDEIQVCINEQKNQWPAKEYYYILPLVNYFVNIEFNIKVNTLYMYRTDLQILLHGVQYTDLQYRLFTFVYMYI